MSKNTDKFADILKNGCIDLGLDLDDACYRRLLAYHALLVKWNQAYNLSAIRDPEEMLYKHLLDSLSIAPLLLSTSASQILDVGTGAGLPGLPLAICCPHKHLTLLDSAGKKTRFLTQVKQALNVVNVSVENRRVENHDKLNSYHIIISRAFASLSDMVSWCSHLLAENGEFWAMKGLFPETELSALGKNYKVESCSDLAVPGGIGERCIVRMSICDHAQLDSKFSRH